MTITKTCIRGIGGYLPDKILRNDDISEYLDTNDAWIRQHTGITERRVAAEKENTSDLALAAGLKATYGMDLSEIDVVIVATVTPDRTFPSSAAVVQSRLGISRAMAFDIQAACSGFIYGLSLANGLLISGHARNVLLIGADIMTRIVDWKDRSTAILFGDGAGAVVLGSSEGETSTRSLLSVCAYNDGSLSEILYTSGGVSSTQTSGTICMNGRAVFKHAIDRMSDAIMLELEKNNLSVNDVSWLIPHQANARIIESLSERMGLPMEKIVMTVDRHANTSAASIPLALSESYHLFSSGDLVVLAAVGAGFSWGAAIIRW